MKTRELARQDMAALKQALSALVKAGDDSLRAGYNLGQIIDALQNIYTLSTMAEFCYRSESTLARYARLYRHYASIDDLLSTAHQIETFDISILVSGPAVVAMKYAYQCGTCGSWDTHRKPVTAGKENS